MRGKRGITFFYYLMMGMVIIILGIALAFPTKSVVDEARADQGITCSAPASDFDEAACLGLDVIKFLFVGMVIFIGFQVLIKR